MDIPFVCDMLVDQNRFCGSDPIGHKCNLPAKWQTVSGHLMCDRCRELLTADPERLTLPPAPFYGQEYQTTSIQAALEALTRKPA